MVRAAKDVHVIFRKKTCLYATSLHEVILCMWIEQLPEVLILILLLLTPGE